MSYIVTTDGHTPFAMNPQRRPPRFSGSTWAATLANVTFYTSRAVADFVEWIEARDPHAVIVAVGDHLPPLEEGGGSYRAEGYSVTPGIPNDSIDFYATPIVMRAAGKTVALGPTPHHALAEKALDLLLGGAYCQDGRCESSANLIYRPRGAEAFFTTG